MLDHRSPQAQYIRQASALCDAVMKRGQRMSVAPSNVRAELLAQCLPFFTELRELARVRFAKRTSFILVAIDEYESAIKTLAGLNDGKITEDHRDGTGSCPVCGTPITHMPEYQLVLCGMCDKPYMAAYIKLDSSEGFGTWAI